MPKVGYGRKPPYARKPRKLPPFTTEPADPMGSDDADTGLPEAPEEAAPQTGPPPGQSTLSAMRPQRISIGQQYKEINKAFGNPRKAR